MRSVKDIIIGFLLILIGFALSAYSLPVSIAVAVGGLAMVVLGALPKGIGKKRQEETPPEPPAGAEPEPDALQPELLPDILTDLAEKPEPAPAPAPPVQPDTELLYQTLSEAYTRIDALPCRGAAWMLERDIRLCGAFRERWDGARQQPPFAALLRSKARYNDYSDEFLLPGFGRNGRIPGRRTSGDLLDDLSGAILKRVAQQQTALQSALQAQKWFESVLKRLQRVQPEPGEAAPAPPNADWKLPEAAPLTRATSREELDTFFVLACKTTGKRAARDELVQLAILKFRLFSPQALLCTCFRPEKGLTKYAHESGVTDGMVEGAPAIGQALASIDAFLDGGAPLVLFQPEQLAFLAAAGSRTVDGRAVYDVKTLAGQKTGQKVQTLDDAFGALFSFAPELGGAGQEALACGLVFCELCDRTLGLTRK